MLIDVVASYRGIPPGRYDVRVENGTLFIFHPGSAMPCAFMARSSYEQAVASGLITLAISAEVNPFSVGMLQIVATPTYVEALVFGQSISRREYGHA